MLQNEKDEIRQQPFFGSISSYKEENGLEKLKQALYLNLIKDDRWQYLTGGLKNTLIITLFATLIGIALGLLIAIVRATHDKTGKMKFLNGVCQVYLTVIRGTPVVIQLMIFYYCIFVSRVFPFRYHVDRRGTDGGRSKPWF